MVFVLTLSLTCFSQTPYKGWSLLTNESRDTIIQGPYNDFVMMASKRMVSNQLGGELLIAVVQLNKIIQSLEETVASFTITNAGLNPVYTNGPSADPLPVYDPKAL